GMDSENGSARFGQRGLVIPSVSPIRSADFHELSAALAEDIRDAETATNFHRLAARNDDLPPGGEDLQHHEQCRSVVVDHDAVLGAGGAANELANVLVATAPFAGFEV